jgi:hypothetical protein
MQHQARLLLFGFVGTKRIDGRVTASQIAAASLVADAPNCDFGRPPRYPMACY